MVRYKKFLRLFFFNGLVLIFLFTAFFFSAEIYCRLKGICKLDGFRYSDWPNMDIFKPSNFLPFELVPNIPGYSNSLGMRDKEYELKKNPGVYRIIVVGDSITMYGHYTDFLEEFLNNKEKSSYEVWNCAIGGHGIKDYYYNLVYRCLDFGPDMLIIGFCLNDFALTPVIFKVGKSMHCYRPFRLFKSDWDAQLYCHSNLYRFILTVLESRVVKKNKMDTGEIGRLYLSKIKEITVQKNIPFFVVIFPYFKTDSESTPEYIMMKKVIEELQIDYIDLHNIFRKEQRYKYVTPTDYIHPDDNCHRIVAELLYRKIIENRGSIF